MQPLNRGPNCHLHGYIPSGPLKFTRTTLCTLCPSQLLSLEETKHQNFTAIFNHLDQLLMSIEFQETAALPKTILRTIKREYLKLQPDEKINIATTKDLDNTSVKQMSLSLKAPFTNCVCNTSTEPKVRIAKILNRVPLFYELYRRALIFYSANRKR